MEGKGIIVTEYVLCSTHYITTVISFSLCISSITGFTLKTTKTQSG